MRVFSSTSPPCIGYSSLSPYTTRPNQQRAEGAGYGRLKADTREQILVLIVLVLILSWIGSTSCLYRTAAVTVIRCGCTSSIHVAHGFVYLFQNLFVRSKYMYCSSCCFEVLGTTRTHIPMNEARTSTSVKHLKNFEF